MVRARVYRHDVRCPHCGSNWMPKNGLARVRQVTAAGTAGAAMRQAPSALRERNRRHPEGRVGQEPALVVS